MLFDSFVNVYRMFFITISPIRSFMIFPCLSVQKLYIYTVPKFNQDVNRQYRPITNEETVNSFIIKSSLDPDRFIGELCQTFKGGPELILLIYF